LVAEEDCAARSLVKGEVQNKHLNGDIEEVSDHDSDNEQMPKKNADSESSDVAKSEEGGSKPEPAKRSEYLENKKKNVAELQKKLEEVKAQFPIPDDPISGEIVPKQAPKRTVSKKAPSDETVIRRESQRNKDRRSVLYCHICDDLLTTSSLFSVPTTSASELTNATADSDAVEESPQPANPSATPNLSAAPASPISPAEPSTVVQNTIVDALHDNPAPVANDPEVGQSAPSVIGGGNTNDAVMEDATSSPSPPKLETRNDEDLPNDPEVGQSAPSVIGGGNTNDVVMEDATSSSSPPKLETRNDEDLPGWLAQMIVYLRGVSEEAAWQNLVTGFVDFEKCGPPAGVSSFFLRRHETD